jgi:hypothetical protein
VKFVRAVGDVMTVEMFGPAEVGPGDCMVRVNLHHLVSILLNAFAAHPHLIINRGRALQVRTKPGIDDCTPFLSPGEYERLGRHAGDEVVNCTLVPVKHLVLLPADVVIPRDLQVPMLQNTRG